MMENISELPINQKEYLKKYLKIGRAPGEKKKKKNKAKATARVQIIDDDVDHSFPSNNTVEEGPIIIDEDAPQIVAIIDERPPSLRIDEKTNNPLWQPVGEARNIVDQDVKPVIKGFKIGQKNNELVFLKPDRALPRKKKRNDDSSPPRSRKENDLSPKRMKVRNDTSPPRRSNHAEDASPPRRQREGSPLYTGMVIKQERMSVSPSRRSRNEEDISPPRKTRRDDQDNSPPRRNKVGSKHDDMSPPRRSSKRVDDVSPPRRKRDSGSSKRSNSRWDHDSSVQKSRHSDKTAMPNSSRNEERSEKRRERMEKTLDGKRAGLQDARELIEETRNYKTREDKLFKSLTKEVSGENAETVHRERGTGKIRNFEEEEERQRKKREEEAKNKEKYDKWGRGVAQIESREEQLKEQLHEMNKPLARYADDEDLERYLKEQEREGDPMLAYLRKKKKKTAAEKGEVTKPQFEGAFMPNRYGIRPGHRWDGVDRSGGYEKRWFEVQNEKRAMMEDAYKWSTEDM